MILLSNSTTQTVQPGEAIAFDLETFKSGCCECHRQGSSAIKLKKCGVYELMFTGNVGGTAVGTVQLQMEAGGEVLPETTIIVTEELFCQHLVRYILPSHRFGGFHSAKKSTEQSMQ